MSKSSVLVIGGAGYIGSHMLLALREAGFQPVVFDNLSRGFADSVGNAELVVGDLLNPADIDKCLRSQAFDLVMHFAAFAYVGESVANPAIYYENNVVGAVNLLAAMRRHELSRLVFSSSCATYGESGNRSITERDPQLPINPYGQSKLFMEKMLQDYGRAYGFNSISLRYFNAAGADEKLRAGERHDPEPHLIPLVLQEAFRLKNGGNPDETRLTVYGTNLNTPDGSCVRDYIHVTDLCQAHLLAAERLLSGRVQGAEFFNLGNQHGFSVLQIIEVCREVTGQPITFRVAPPRAGDPAALVSNTTLARDVLGWGPQRTDLHAIIQTAWDWMLAHPQDLKI